MVSRTTAIPGPRNCYHAGMCRSIKTLRGQQPPPTSDEVPAAALQYVRKISGYRAPSKKNAEAFDSAVADIAAVPPRPPQAVDVRE